MTDFNKIKEAFIELILASTCHGLPSIFRTKRIIFKLMWLFTLIGCSSFCFHLIYKSINDYFDYDVVTKIDLYKEIVSQFPTVTFCNLNAKYSPYVLNETIILCTFNSQKCSLSEIKWYFSGVYGYCFTFNSGFNIMNEKISIKESNIAGFIYGLKIIIFAGYDSLLPSTGFHLFIHNNSYNPDFNSGVDIPIGMTTKISIRRDYYEKLGEPYNNCETDLTTPDSYNSEIFKDILNQGLVYNQKNCINYLGFTNIARKCNCSTNLINLEKNCITKNKECSFNYYQKFYAEENIKTLKALCPYECNTIDYLITNSLSDIEYSYIRYLIQSHSTLLSLFGNQAITDDVLKKTFLQAYIYYEDLSYRLISQSVKTSTIDLVSNIGGLLGLFIGTSFLSFVEIIEISFELIFVCFETRKKINVSRKL